MILKNMISVAAEDLGYIETIIENNSFSEPSKIKTYIDRLKGKYNNENIIKDFSNDLHEEYEIKYPNGRVRKGVIDRSKIKSDLNKIRGKLEMFINTEGFNFEKEKEEDSGKVTINLTNTQTQEQSQTQTIKVENIIEQISNSSSLDQKTIDEIVSKLKQIEDIISTSDKTKAQKWQKIKDIGKYLLDKSIDVGILTLPYIVDSAKRL